MSKQKPYKKGDKIL